MAKNKKQTECAMLIWNRDEPAETFKDNYEAMLNEGWVVEAFIPESPSEAYTSVLFKRLTESGRQAMKEAMEKRNRQSGLTTLRLKQK